MIRIDHTDDYDLIRAVMTAPSVYPHITDDFSPPAGEYCPSVHEQMWYVAVWWENEWKDWGDDDELLGLFLFVPQNGVCWEVHTCLLPCARGPRARLAAKAVTAWIWANTPCRRIVTNVPETNRLALHFALDVGMAIWGRNEASFLKGGRLVDQVCLGISAPKEIAIADVSRPAEASVGFSEGIGG